MYSKQCKCINVQCKMYKCTGCTECTPWDWQAAKEPLTFDQLEQRFRNNNKLINIIFIFSKIQTCAQKSDTRNQSKKIKEVFSKKAHNINNII